MGDKIDVQQAKAHQEKPAKDNHDEKKPHGHHHKGKSAPSSGNNTAHNNIPTKEDLWKGAEVKTLADNPGWIVEMTGLDSKTHTVYARAVPTADYKPSVHENPSVKEVIESVVDVAWKHVAKHILEAKKGGGKDEILMVDLDHWDQGAFPPANQLLELGAVWLVNETSFLQNQAVTNTKKHHHPHTKKKRLTNAKHGEQQPDWKDYVLRVHYAPNRYHAMEEVDWSKYCRGLLLGDHSVQIFLKGKELSAYEHVLPSGYPDQKDGVIVYEDAEHGFVVLNKPGTVPDHATVNNHAEDVLTAFHHVLEDREKQTRKEPKDKSHSKDLHHHNRIKHLTLPLPLDTETQGLIIIATKRAFHTYLTNMVEHPHSKNGVIKKYKCLVCVKKPEDLLTLNNLQESRAVVKHYYHYNPNHKDHTNFVKAIPKGQHPHEYGTSEVRLLKIGTNHGLYAANVTADKTVGDIHLAHRLWGLGVQNHSKTPAEDLGVAYVAQLEIEEVVDAEQLHTHLNKASRLTPQQLICGQLAAMGFPLVGDVGHGGGTSEVWGHRHGWNRLALQCCEWSFPVPKWNTPKEAGIEEAPKDEKKEDQQQKEDEKKEGQQQKEEQQQKAGEESEEWTTVSNASKKTNSAHSTKSGTSTKAADKHYLQATPEGRCVFRLNEAWWNPLLDHYHVDGF